jgi:Activator of Hsp90 ATPase homolog 1-like protein
MTEDLPPIVREFEVRCSVDHAFDTWTRRIDLWWPLARHSVSRENAASVAIEPRHGGRIFETTRDGKEIVWGTVNMWEPPNRFGYLWHIGEEDASEATQVTITFTVLDLARTHVAIMHKGWEHAGPKAGSRRRGNERGWDGLIPAFTRFIAGATRQAAQRSGM